MMYSEDIARKRFVIQAYSVVSPDEFKESLDEFCLRYGYDDYLIAKENGINVFEEPYTSDLILFLKDKKPPKYISTLTGLSGGKGFG